MFPRADIKRLPFLLSLEELKSVCQLFLLLFLVYIIEFIFSFAFSLWSNYIYKTHVVFIIVYVYHIKNISTKISNV